MELNFLLVLNIIILIDIAVIILIGFIFSYICNSKTNSIVENTLKALPMLLDDEADFAVFASCDKEMKDFYNELEMVFLTFRARENNRREVLNITNTVATNMELSALLDELLPKVMKATNSSCGAFYLANHATNKLEIKSSKGFSKNIYGEFDIAIGDGFIGMVTNEVRIVNNIPDDSIYIMRSFLGKIKPKSMMIIPINENEKLIGVFALASVFNYKSNQSDFIDLVRYYIGIAIGNAINNEQNQRLTRELKFQNTLIQNLNEDLEKKINNRTVFLNSIIDSIKDYAIYAFDVNYVINAWNKGAEHMLGYSKDETLGKHVDIITPKSEAKDNNIQQKVETAIRDGRYEESGWRMKRDGSSYYSETTLFPMYNEGGEVVGFTKVIKDITYIKNVEKALGYEKEFAQRIFETSHQAVIIASQTGIIEMANKTAKVLLNTDEPIGVDLCNFFVDEEYLRKNMIDVAQRYGKGEWAAILKRNKKKIIFSVYVLMEANTNESKLYVYLSE